MSGGPALAGCWSHPTKREGAFRPRQPHAPYTASRQLALRLAGFGGTARNDSRFGIAEDASELIDAVLLFDQDVLEEDFEGPISAG